MGSVVGTVVFVAIVLGFGVLMSESDSFKKELLPGSDTDANKLNRGGLWVTVGIILVLGMLAMGGMLRR